MAIEIGNAYPVARTEILFCGQQFVMVQTARIHYGPMGNFERPYRTELYRVDPADGIEMFVSFVDPEGSPSNSWRLVA